MHIKNHSTKRFATVDEAYEAVMVLRASYGL